MQKASHASMMLRANDHEREDETDLEGSCDSDTAGETEHMHRVRCVSLFGTVAAVAAFAVLAVTLWTGLVVMPAHRGQGAATMKSTASRPAISSLVVAGTASGSAAISDERFCNPEIPLPQSVHPRKFNMTHDMQKLCTPDAVPWPRWKGRNLCWGWVKMYGCMSAHGHTSWEEAHNRSAAVKRVPNSSRVTFQGLTRPELCDRVDLGAYGGQTPEELRAAYEWLDANVAIYVMNLDTDTERLARFNETMTSLSLNFTRIKGIDMRLPGALEEAKQNGTVPATYNVTKAKELAANNTQAMGIVTGTVGIAAAHLHGISVAKANSSKPLAVIFEDDVTPEPDFALKLRRLVRQESPCDWEVISLKSRCPYGRCVSRHLTRVEPDGNEPAERCRHGVNYGFFAMLYRLDTVESVKAKLADAVWSADRPHCLDIDVALASISDKVNYYAVPAVQMPGLLHEGGMGSSRTRGNWFDIGQGLKDGEK